MAKRGSRTGTVVLLLIIAGFLAGLANLFLLRFETGDFYPAYSSLRSDPLGTKIFFESLDRLDEITAVRNYQPASRIGQYGNSTFFVIGASSSLLESMSEQEARAFRNFVTGGGRLVLLFYPLKHKRPQPKQEVSEKKESEAEQEREKGTVKKGPEKKKDGRTAGDDARLSRTVPAVPWKIEMSQDEAPAAAEDGAAVPSGRYGFRQPVSWHSSLWFKGAGPEWRTVYARGGKPVLVERAYGKGSIVLASDSFSASNEAAVRERHAELLAWLVGGSSLVVFDETHFGIHETPGVAALIRKYRLQALPGGFLLLAVLFVWKNSSSLVPPRDDAEGRDGIRTEKDHVSGFAGLLGRTISRGEILAVCVSEWKKTNRTGGGRAARDLASIEAIVEAERRRSGREQDPVMGYRAIQKLLSERKRT